MLIATNLLPYSITSISPRKTTVLSSFTTENDIQQSDQTKLKPLENPTVQKALKRWLPESKEILVFDLPNHATKKERALSFLANPTKLGIANFVIWTTVWSVSSVLFDYTLQLFGKSLDFFHLKDVNPEKSLIEFIKKNWRQTAVVIGISAGYEIVEGVYKAKYQQKTNTIALEALKNKGINAKLDDANTK